MTETERLALIAGIIKDYGLDEHEGDWAERAETVLWIATEGREGRDWGHRPAEDEDVG